VQESGIVGLFDIFARSKIKAEPQRNKTGNGTEQSRQGIFLFILSEDWGSESQRLLKTNNNPEVFHARVLMRERRYL
jgi:hypothetical protein